MFNLLDHVGKRVHVFLDLHRPYRWVINTHEGNLKEGRRLNGIRKKKGAKDPDFNHTLYVGLIDCEFVIDEGKRKKARERIVPLKHRTKVGKKDIHAWVIGTLVRYEDVAAYCNMEVTYHFAKYPSYYVEVMERVGTNIKRVDMERPVRVSKMAAFAYETESGWLPLRVPRPHT